MNFKEIKCFATSEKSRNWLKVNGDDLVPPFELYDIIPITIDFDRIVAFRPHSIEVNATVLEIQGSSDTILPMNYDDFKMFFKKASNNTSI